MNKADIQRELLLALRNMARRQADAAAILQLSIADVASQAGASETATRDVLKDLLLEGLAEPYTTTFEDRAEDGHCRITERGMEELRQLL